MLQTILILIFTLIVVPIVSYNYGTPLNEIQETLLFESSMIALGVSLYCFVVGEITRNVSQTDKLWSIVPAVYSWYITLHSGMNERMVLMSVLVTIWAVRLSLNFARRGGFSLKFWEGEEDYRWEVLRQRPGFNNKFVWMLFNLFFICLYQQGLIYMFTVPILAGLADTAPALFWADYLLAAVFLGLIIMEGVADQQQWNFQTEKYRRINAGEDLGEYAHGFVRTGLWGIMRHPNYMAEQSIWVCFYLFSIACTGEWINGSIAGSLLLLILFRSSSDFSEEISAEKYPEYADYQKKVPRFLPIKLW
jgi:steroid 5-alpha reductase family enzyme